jgi:hypothetical protein
MFFLRKPCVTVALLCVVILLSSCQPAVAPEISPSSTAMTDTTPEIAASPEWIDPWLAYNVMLHELADALLLCDYESVFELQRSDLYHEMFIDLGGHLPGGWFEIDDKTHFSYWGKTDDTDVSGVHIYHSATGVFDDEDINARVSAIRELGVTYMLIGEYIDGMANGNFTIYRQYDSATNAVEIRRLMVRDDIFVGDGSCEIYENGEIKETVEISAYGGTEVWMKLGDTELEILEKLGNVLD